MSENLMESLFGFSHFPICLSTRPPTLNVVALLFIFQVTKEGGRRKRKSGVWLVIPRSVAWEAEGEPEATCRRMSPTLSWKHKCLSSEGQSAFLESYLKIIPNKFQNEDFKWNTQKSKHSETEDLKSLWNVHSQRFVLCNWWGFRFSSHLPVPPGTKVSEATSPLEATVKRPWQRSPASKRTKIPRPQGQKRYWKPSPWQPTPSCLEMPTHPTDWLIEDQTISKHACWLKSAHLGCKDSFQIAILLHLWSK